MGSEGLGGQESPEGEDLKFDNIPRVSSLGLLLSPEASTSVLGHPA